MPVRAVARDPASAGLPHGIEVVRGDLSTASTLHAALDGVDAVFLVWPLLTAKAAPALLRAVAQHARRIVYLSSMSVRDDCDRQADPISACHASIERLIQRSGLPWTLLRSSGFAANTLLWAPQIRADGVVRWPYGAARRSLIHERDIAAVATRALSGDGHGAKTYLLTGPETLTQIEQVRTISDAIGRPLRYQEISSRAARQRLLTAWGMPSAAAHLLPSRSRVRRIADGALDAWATMVDEPEPVTPTVQEITGAPASTFRQWAIDHADDFRAQG